MSATPPSASPDRSAAPSVIPVVEERLHISQQRDETGRSVRVRIETQDVPVQVPVTDWVEEVSVEHVPISRYVSERYPIREEGDTVIVPVFVEVAVVEKRLLLSEEIRICRQRLAVERQERVVLQREVPIVEHRSAAGAPWQTDRETDPQQERTAPDAYQPTPGT